MKRSKFYCCLTLMVLFSGIQSVVMNSQAFAVEKKGTPAFPLESREKFRRGVANTFTGWTEVPHTVESTAKKYDDPFRAGTQGLAKGVGMAIARTGVGIFEALNPWNSAPKNYEPLMEPAYVDPSLEKSSMSVDQGPAVR